MSLLEVKNLQVRVEEREILHGLSLTVNKGEVHAIMGPNGSGKSTLSHVIAGKPGYEVTGGEILFNGEDVLEMEPNERAAKGVFLAFQYPVEIPGVATMTFLRTALNAQRKARGESEFSTPDFLKKVREVASRLNIPQDMLRRGVNVGFSGGEKKRNEVLQMALFEPSLCILDEMDSGLDIDALRIAADGVNALRSKDRAMVVLSLIHISADRLGRRQRAPVSGSRVPRDHALSAAAELHRSGRRARDVEGPGGEEWRQGTGARAGGVRLRPVRRRRRVSEPIMNVALVKSNMERSLGEVFAAARSRLPGTGAVAETRQKAFEEFARQGLPHRRVEEWKYTDLRVLLREVAPLAEAPDQAAFARAAAAVKSLGINGTQKLVLVDGVFAPQLSDIAALEAGLRVQALREVLETSGEILKAGVASDAVISLNTAMATDGVVVAVADGAVLAKPVHVVHVATRSGAAAFTRSQLTVGKGARATLVESFIAAEGATAYQAHDAVIVSVGDGAELQHVRLMEDALDAANITTGFFRLGGKAKLNTFNLTRGGSVSRYQGFITFAGEGSELATNGVNLLGGRRHGDTTLLVEDVYKRQLLVDHAVPHCESRELFKGVLDGHGRGVFQGKIIVRPDAQKTDGKMMTRALLLSDEAEMDNKPELEIFADDVTCGHGATAGALDESLLFYLRARGLPEKEAQALLIEAFVGEAIESIVDDDLRDVAVATAQRWLAVRD